MRRFSSVVGIAAVGIGVVVSAGEGKPTFWHVGRSPSDGRLEVGADMYGGALRLWVLDDGPRGAPPVQGAGEESGQGIGLSNTRARLNRLYGAAASLGLEPLDGGGTRAVIRIPVRNGALAHA